MADAQVLAAQSWINTTYGPTILVEADGRTGWRTMFALIRALQTELGITTLSDAFGPTTSTQFALKIGSISATTPPDVIRIVRCALWCKGYPGGDVANGSHDDALAASLVRVKNDMGVLGGNPFDVKLMKSLLSMDAYVLLPQGRALVQKVQRWLNQTYVARRDFTVIPADGIFSRDVQKGLMLALQYNLGMADGVANGNFGAGTQAALQVQGTVQLGSVDTVSRRLVTLFQGALIFNGFDAPFLTNLSAPGLNPNVTFDERTQALTTRFQEFTELPRTAKGDHATWCSLLVSTGDPNRAVTACDTNTPLTPATVSTLRGSGYQTVGRYMSVPAKRYRHAEIQHILDGGLTTFPIFQEYNNEAKWFSFEQGLAQGLSAVRRARQLGIEPGSVLYFAVDWDATGDEISSRVIDHFTGIAEGVGAAAGHRYRVGVYGTRNVCSVVCGHDLAVSAFVSGISKGWSGNLGFRLPDGWAYDQIATVTVGSGAGAVTIDKVVKSSVAEPLGRADFRPTPSGTDDAGFNRHWWALVALQIHADTIVGHHSTLTQKNANDFVLNFLQLGRYWDVKFKLYTPRKEDVVMNSTLLAARTTFLDTAGPTPTGLDYDGDGPHLAASARGYTTWTVPGADVAHTAVLADLGGWALDLATLWNDYVSARRVDASLRTESWFRAHTGAPGAEGGHFGAGDLIADVDAYLVARMMEEEPDRDFADVFREVLVRAQADPRWRFRVFFEQRFLGSWEVAASAVRSLFTTDTLWIQVPRELTVDGRRAGEHELDGDPEGEELDGELDGLVAGFVAALRDRVEGR